MAWEQTGTAAIHTGDAAACTTTVPAREPARNKAGTTGSAAIPTCSACQQTCTTCTTAVPAGDAAREPACNKAHAAGSTATHTCTATVATGKPACKVSGFAACEQTCTAACTTCAATAPASDPHRYTPSGQAGSAGPAETHETRTAIRKGCQVR